MDSHFCTDTVSGLASTVGTKGKALQLRPARTKKARGNGTASEPTADNSGLSDYKDSESNGSVDESAFTPLTPVSATSSHRHPSDINKIHLCTFDGCTKSFNRPAKLEQHLRSHTNTRPFVCPEAACNKDFLRESHLTHHIKSAHSDVRDYACGWDGCDKKFITSTRLKRHQAAHEGREKFRCIAPGCGQTFRKHLTLQAHIAKIHEGRKPFVCSFLQDGKRCGAGFETAAKLLSHQGRIHEMKRYSCTICSLEDGVAFSTYSELLDHMGTDHPPKCTECGLKCSTQRELKIHVEIQHGTVDLDERRTHICPEPDCGAGFTKKNNLNVHIRTVHGNTRFVCGDIDPATLKNVGEWDGSGACGIATTTKANLEHHIRTVHLGLPWNSKGKLQWKRRRAQRKEVSATAWLTGYGYGEESGQHIACLVQDCDHCFLEENDHESHLKFHHALADVEVQALRTRAEDGDALFARAAFQDSTAFATTEDLEAERAFDMYPGGDLDMDDAEDSLERAAFRGDPFWFGGPPDVMTEDGDDEWLGEMRQLINDDYDMNDFGEDDGGYDRTMLDPALL